MDTALAEAYPPSVLVVALAVVHHHPHRRSSHNTVVLSKPMASALAPRQALMIWLLSMSMRVLDKEEILRSEKSQQRNLYQREEL